jgi:hypothetical protein
MTEQEWLQSPEPVQMVTHLCDHSGVPRTKGGRRKLRLFGCACCRRAVSLFPGEPWWSVVDLAERLADGTVSKTEVEGALQEVEPLVPDGEGDQVRQARRSLYSAVCQLCRSAQTAAVACSLVGKARRWLGCGEAEECAVQADLVRDLFGNPFGTPPSIPASVLQWSQGIVRRLAEETYKQRQLPSGQLDNARLAVLADALEEAGCQDQDILGHLRQPEAIHVRGCSVLDALLDKE